MIKAQFLDKEIERYHTKLKEIFPELGALPLEEAIALAKKKKKKLDSQKREALDFILMRLETKRSVEKELELPHLKHEQYYKVHERLEKVEIWAAKFLLPFHQILDEGYKLIDKRIEEFQGSILDELVVQISKEIQDLILKSAKVEGSIEGQPTLYDVQEVLRRTQAFRDLLFACNLKKYILQKKPDLR